MENKLVEIVLTYTGLAGLGLIVFYYLFRDIIRRNIFSTLTKTQSFKTIRLILILVWLVALFAISAWVYHDLRVKEIGQLGLKWPPPPPFVGNDQLRLVDVSFEKSPDSSDL